MLTESAKAKRDNRLLSIADVPDDIGDPLRREIGKLIGSFPALMILREDQSIHWVSEGFDQAFGYNTGSLVERNLDIILSNAERGDNKRRIFLTIEQAWASHEDPEKVTMTPMGERPTIQGRKQNGDFVNIQVLLLVGFDAEKKTKIRGKIRPRGYVAGFVRFFNEVDSKSKLRVFHSYKRDKRDKSGGLIKAQSSELALALGAELDRSEKVDPWLDLYQIQQGKDWKQEIIDGLDGSGAMICIISEDYIKSVECIFECDYAIDLGITIITIIDGPLPENFLDERLVDLKTGEEQACGALPKEIQAIQFIDSWDSIGQLAQLVTEILDPEIMHARYYGDLMAAATRWKNGKRSNTLLLKGLGLTNAIAWRNRDKVPRPNELQTQFINASISQRRRKKLRWTGLAFIGCVAAIVTGFETRRRFHTPVDILARMLLANATSSERYTRQNMIRLNNLLNRAKRSRNNDPSGYEVIDISYFEYRNELITQVASSEHLETNPDVVGENENDLIHFELARELPPERVTQLHNEGFCAPTIEPALDRLILSCPVRKTSIEAGRKNQEVLGFVIASFNGQISFGSVYDEPQNYVWGVAEDIEHELFEFSRQKAQLIALSSNED